MKALPTPNFFISLAICIFNISCIFPVYIPPSHGMKLIDTSNVKPGVTTKEDVFLRFGDAFSIREDEKLFTARYILKGGYAAWVWAVPYGPMGTFGEKTSENVYELEIEFDDKDVVKRCETFKLPRKISQ